MTNHKCMHCDCANFKNKPCCFCNKIKGQTESRLVEHAKRELELLDTENWFSDMLQACVYAFDNSGHGANSRQFSLPVLMELLSGNPLSPLTDDPNEWIKTSDEVWQNIRQSAAVSEDGGKTYILLNEATANPEEEPPIHESMTKAKHVEVMEKLKESDDEYVEIELPHPVPDEVMEEFEERVRHTDEGIGTEVPTEES